MTTTKNFRYRVATFIKPGCYAKDIITLILGALFTTDEAHSCKKNLTPEILQAVYPDLVEQKDLWGAVETHLLNKKVDVLTLFINGQRDLDRLIKIVGKDIDPIKCEVGTLRHSFGGKTLPIPNSKKLWYVNNVHRPKTMDEVEKQFNAFFPKESWSDKIKYD